MPGVVKIGVFAVSIGAQTAAAAGRALMIAALTVGLAARLSPWITSRSGRERTLAWALLLAPFFTPSLLISYAFSKFALALVVSPWSHEALYISVLALKMMPVAVILRRHLPSPLSPEALQIYRMHGHAGWRERMIFRLRGAGDGPWITGGLVFLLAFADFELASLWSIHTWTIAIFDAQIGGLALADTLRLAALPCGIALGVVAWMTLRSRQLVFAAATGRPVKDRWPWWYLGLSAFGVTCIPLAIVLVQAITGLRSLVENFVLGPEIGASLALAVTATILADIGVRLVRQNRTATILAVAPGLIGALSISLVVLAIFQMPGLHRAYDTPLPLALTLGILLLPLAVLLGALRPRHTPALHMARQLSSRRLLWELETRPHIIGCALLFCWAYFDFTAASILAPVGVTPVFVRLHNLAHYGQTAVLSAMMLAAFTTPILVLLLTGAALHLYARRDGR
jgi:hypothetical protein